MEACKKTKDVVKMKESQENDGSLSDLEAEDKVKTLLEGVQTSFGTVKRKINSYLYSTSILQY